MNQKREYTKFESYKFEFKADEQLSDTLENTLIFAYKVKEAYAKSSDVVKNRPELWSIKPKALSESIGKTLSETDDSDSSYYIYSVPSDYFFSAEFRFLDRYQTQQALKIELRGHTSGFYSNLELSDENVFLIKQACSLFMTWLKSLEKIINNADQEFSYDLKKASLEPISQRRKALNSIDDLALLKTNIPTSDGHILELALKNILSITQFKHFKDRCNDLEYENSFSKH